nr:MAG TPA: hypothetical protein [Caudoviricetes sp.]
MKNVKDAKALFFCPFITNFQKSHFLFDFVFLRYYAFSG